MSETQPTQGDLVPFVRQKNEFNSRNFDNFIDDALHVPYPNYLSSLFSQKIISHVQNSALRELWTHCYKKNLLNFELTISEIGEVMRLSRSVTVSTLRILKKQNILISGRLGTNPNSVNAPMGYRWNVELWTGGKGAVHEMNRHGSESKPSRFRKQTATVQEVNYVYIQEYLLEYLLRISLRIVEKQVRQSVDNSQSGSLGEFNVDLSVEFSINQKVAFWEKAVVETIPADRRYLALWFFNDSMFNFSEIEWPEKLCEKYFCDGQYEAQVHKENGYAFQNQVEYFELYKKYLFKELPEQGKGE